MNSTMRIQIIVDARNARAQLTQLTGQLSAVSKVIQTHQSKMNKISESAGKAQSTAENVAVRRQIQNDAAQLKAQQSVSAQQAKLNQNLAVNQLKNAESVLEKQDAIKARQVESAQKAAQRIAEAESKGQIRVAAAQGKADQALEAGHLRNNLRLEQAEQVHQAKMVQTAESGQARAAQKLQQSDDAHLARMGQGQAKADAALEAQRARSASALGAQEARQNNALAAQAEGLGARLSALKSKLTGSSSGVAGGAQQVGLLGRAWAALKTPLSSSLSLLGQAGDKLKSIGKSMGQVGRSLTTAVTVPIALVAKAGLSMALDMDRAMTRVKKVYGEVGQNAGELNSQTQELQRTFFALSNLYGVHVEEVTAIGAAWAEAGAKGTTLQRVTEQTIKAMKLGDLTSEQAVKGLITLADTYGLTSKVMDDTGNVIENSLTNALATFNAVENATAINMDDLIVGVSKAGSEARTSGIDIRHLAAMMSALVPSTGDAAEAGNALKTVIAQIGAPSKPASKALKALGIDIDSVAWRSKNLTERFDDISKSVAGLTNNQKLQFSRDVVNLRQTNKFIALLDDMVKGNSNYQKSLDVTADKTKTLAEADQELAAIMDSPSQRFTMWTNSLRNTLIQAVLPLLPALNNLGLMVLKVTTWFSSLSPHTQRMIIYFLLLAATLGPILIFLGAIAGAVGTLIEAFVGFMGALEAIGGAGAAVVGGLSASAIAVILLIVAILALIVVIYIYRRQIKDALADTAQWIGGGLSKAFQAVAGAVTGTFHSLAGSVEDAMHAVMKAITGTLGGIGEITYKALRFVPQAFADTYTTVVKIVGIAAQQVYKLLSWMNPFARHSPSLVEQVQDGTQIIGQAYARVADSVSSSMQQVEAQVRRLGASIAQAKQAADAAQMSENIKFAVAAGADPAEVESLIHTVAALNVQLANLKNDIAAQKNVTEAWKTELDAASKSLEDAEKQLKTLQDVVSDFDDQISASKDRLQGWLDAPITGTYAFEDAIFSNDQAQKALQLQVAQLTKQILDAGYSVDEVRQYMDDQAKAAADAAHANDALSDSLANSGLNADETKQRMASLRTEIEDLQGQSLDLRLQGAGSDVLGGLQSQIDQADSVRKELAKNLATNDTKGPAPTQATQDAVKQIDELQKALAKLENQGQIFDLQKALALEPAQKAIQDTQRIAEQSFGAIMNGIKTETALTVELTKKRDEATAAVQRQQVAVDALTASRDAIQLAYDAESAKLDILQKQYDSLSDTISFAQDQLDEAFKLGEDVLKKAKEAADAGLGGPGDFATPGGPGGIGNEPFDLKAMQDETDRIMKEFQDKLGQLDPFKPLRDKWNSFKAFLMNLGGFILAPALGLVRLFKEDIPRWVTEGLDFAHENAKKGLIGLFQGGKEVLTTGWDDATGWLKDAFGPIGDSILTHVDDFFARFGARIVEFNSNTMQSLTGPWTDAWHYGGDVVDFARQHMGISFDGIGQAWQGTTQLTQGLMTGNWAMAWEGAKNIVFGIGEQIKSILTGVYNWMLDGTTTTFSNIWASITNLWNQYGYPAFMAIVTWLDSTFLQKFRDMPGAIGNAFSTIGSVISRVFSNIRSVTAGGVNSVITVINGLISGINSVASRLGISFRISPIGYVGSSDPGTGPIGNNAQPFATGGQLPSRQVGEGFVTNGARAIVGEGNPRYPEFVIPTDPKYRARAMGLIGMAAQQLGMASGGVVPQYAVGGLLSSGLAKIAQQAWDSTVSHSRSGAGALVGFPGEVGKVSLEHLITGAVPRITQWIGDWAKKNPITSLFGGASSVLNSLGNIVPLEAGGLIPKIYPMKDGATVKGGHGGVLAAIGDGRKDEIVQPLDKYARKSNAGNTFNFHGDLSFPNIKNGNDAKKFLDNLEALG